jgi:hypothetical protein
MDCHAPGVEDHESAVDQDLPAEPLLAIEATSEQLILQACGQVVDRDRGSRDAVRGPDGQFHFIDRDMLTVDARTHEE